MFLHVLVAQFSTRHNYRARCIWRKTSGVSYPQTDESSASNLTCMSGEPEQERTVMNKRTAGLTSVILAMFLLGLSAVGGLAQEQPMGFFITSVGPGDGANLGGLEGADQHCQMLATAAGAGNRRLPLSASPR